jgi:sec-independent protein translocase protein TatB
LFDVGFNELVLIFIIGLLVLGPQRLPKVAAEVGKWVGRARRTATELRRQLEREIELNDIQPPPSPPPSSTDTQNPFHHTPIDTDASPPTDTASETPTAPPGVAVESAPAASTPETDTASGTAQAPEPVAAPASEAAKAPEPTDRPPHV